MVYYNLNQIMYVCDSIYIFISVCNFSGPATLVRNLHDLNNTLCHRFMTKQNKACKEKKLSSDLWHL